MMSKGEEPSSEEEHDSEEDEESEEDQKKFSRFAFESSEESDENEHRVIKTMKDKRIDAFKKVITEIKNHVKINDFSALQDDFAALNKELDKSRQLIEQEGIPMIYIKGLVLIEDSVNEGKKQKLTTLQNRAWSTLKNKLKKHNKDYEQKITEYRANPIVSDEEKEEKEELEKKSEKSEDEKDEDEDADEDEDKNKDESEEESSEEEIQDRSKMTPEERRKKVKDGKIS